jgi:antitoxin MazE
MLTKVQRWGNSLGVRIPRSFAAHARVTAGSTVDISVDDQGLRIRPVRRSRYVLAQLLEQVSRRNVHEEVATGERVGREAW